MATFYSDAVAIGSYNRIRLRVETNGTSASCHIEFSRTSSWNGTWSDPNASITLNDTRKSAPYNYTGTVNTGWVEIASASGYTIPESGGTLSWSFDNPTSGAVLGCSGTISIVVDPTNSSMTNVIPGTNSFTATVGISAWGGGTASSRYKGLSVCVAQSTSNRRITRVYGDSLSSRITTDNNSSQSGTCTIAPNTRYYLRYSVVNGAGGSVVSDYSAYATLAEAPTITAGEVAEETATLNYATPQDGGFYAKSIEYSIDGEAWTPGATVNGGNAASGSFDIPDLQPGTAYEIQTRVKTTAGTTAGPTVTITTSGTREAYAFYGSVNGQAKKITKLYGGVAVAEMVSPELSDVDGVIAGEIDYSKMALGLTKYILLPEGLNWDELVGQSGTLTISDDGEVTWALGELYNGSIDLLSGSGPEAEDFGFEYTNPGGGFFPAQATVFYQIGETSLKTILIKRLYGSLEGATKTIYEA